MGWFKFIVRTFMNLIITLFPIIIILFPTVLCWFKKKATIVIILFIIIFFVVKYLIVYKPIKNMEEKKRGILDVHFRNWVEGAKYKRKKPKIRVNIMLKKYHVKNFRFHFFQDYQYNMKDYPDCNLNFWIKRGFIGECFKRDIANAPYLCDLRKLTKENIFYYYNFDEELYEKTKHIKAIACVPLQKRSKSFFYPRVPKFKKIGMLCIDAVDDIGADFLYEKPVLQDIKFFSKFVEKIYT